MKNLFLTFSLFALLFNANIFSQQNTKIIPRLGYNLADISGIDVDKHGPLFRTHIGVSFDFPVSQKVSFQPGILLTGKGTEIDWGEGDQDAIALSYFEMPFNFVLNFEKEFQLLAGPYVAICMGGKRKYLADDDYDTESMHIGTTEDDEIKPGDIGLNVGAGYKIKKFQIQAYYSGSITDICPYDEESLRNNVVFVSFGYIFDL